MVGKSLFARLFRKTGAEAATRPGRRASMHTPVVKNGTPRQEFMAAAAVLPEDPGEAVLGSSPATVAVAEMPVAPATPRTDPVPHEVTSELMTAREEISLKITDGLKGLSTILTDIDSKLDDQSKKSTELVQSMRVLPEIMRDLPETSRAGIELLSTISRVLEDQTRATRDMVDRVKEMPSLVAKVSTHLEEQTRILARADDARTHLESAVEGVGSAVGRLADQQRLQEERAREKIEQVQNLTLDELKRMQDRHERHLSDLSHRSQTQIRVITVMTVLVVLIFLAVLTRL